MRLAPSILTADFLNLGEELSAISESDELHLDVMDGHFVPNLTFGPDMTRAIRRGTPLKLVAHLMVKNPDEMAPWFAAAGCDEIVVPAETCPHLHRSLQALHGLGPAAGVALNPSTPLEILRYVYDQVETVLLMTVNPGFGGQKFIPAMLGKIADLRRLRTEWGASFRISVDGGVNIQNVAELHKAGVDAAVVGSAVFGDGDPADRLRQLRQAMCG